MNGVINFLKPPGMTSFQAASFVHRLTGLKTGHAGTLDPEAAGVLPILVGRGTKLFDHIVQGRKVYIAGLLFGVLTDTQDAQGTVVDQSPIRPTQEQVKQMIPDFTGDIMQVPPMYSAIKKDGKRLYALARQGVEVERKARQVRVEQIDYLSEENDGCSLRVVCGKGVYIRTLLADLAASLGALGIMRYLIRERVGGFHINKALTPQELEELVKQYPDGKGWLEDPGDYLPYPKAYVHEKSYKKLINGVPLTKEDVSAFPEENQPVSLYYQNQFFAIGQPEDLRIKSLVRYQL
jgi:tRNA pseudouridine55 synthase